MSPINISGAGNDTIQAGGGYDNVLLRAGTDYILAGAGCDMVNYSRSDEIVNALNDGDLLNDTFAIYAVDGTAENVNVLIVGVTDLNVETNADSDASFIL